MVAVDLRGRTPQQFAAMIADKLARLGIIASALPAGVGDLARDAEPAPPAGAVRAADADPRRLGVHAAISVPGAPDEVLPEYVPRDIDSAGSGVRAKVAAAAERGGFVLLVGGSVGWENPLRGRGREGGAAGLVASPSGGAGRGGRAGADVDVAYGGVAG